MVTELETPIEVLAAAWTDEECARYTAELASRGRTVWDGPGLPSVGGLNAVHSFPDDAFDEPAQPDPWAEIERLGDEQHAAYLAAGGVPVAVPPMPKNEQELAAYLATLPASDEPNPFDIACEDVTTDAGPYGYPVYHPVYDSDIPERQRQMIAEEIDAMNTAWRDGGRKQRTSGIDFDALPD